MNNNINIKEYLTSKNIIFRENGSELVVKCIFSDCDKDSKGSEAHLYFSSDTGQYDCKKCGAKGNLITLRKHFADSLKGDNVRENNKIEEVKKRNVRTLTPKMVQEYHDKLPIDVRKYLNDRGISDEVINKYKLGYANLYGSYYITIPIKDIDGNYSFLKLRQDPKYGNKKITWPKGEGEAQIYDWDSVVNMKDRILITEGETDMLLMESKGISSITSTHGAGTFKESWLEYFNKETTYYICYDNDDAGRKGADRTASILYKNEFKNVYIITLPESVGDKGDLGDYVVRLNLPVEDLFNKYSKVYPEKIDTSVFQPMTVSDIIEVLEPVIKKDDVNKVIATLAMIDTYTDESQINVLFNAPSSTGKSHIPIAISNLFPEEDIIKLANCSPTAFFHEQGRYNKETNEIKIDLSRKIIIFTDMPHTDLLTRLRSFLSHDQKESKSKITDKSEKGGNRTKTVVLIGYPTVMFCSAGLKIDEQESTRFIMLSPSIEQDKLVAGIKQSIDKEIDQKSFKEKIETDPKRILFKKRILAIKQEKISDIKIVNSELVEKLFSPDIKKAVKPRQQRDVKKVICLIKGLALLNMWFRKRDSDYIYATDEDIIEGFKLWESIAVGQDYGLAPYVYKIYTKIIIPLWLDYGKGIERKSILNKHYEIYGQRLSMIYLRQHILTQLEQSGLIIQEKSVDDKRSMLVFPLEIEGEVISNDVKEGGVNIEIVPF